MILFWIQTVKKLAFMIVMVLMFMSMINFSSGIKKMEENKASINHLTKKIYDLQTFLKEDSVRINALEKIDSIMSKYNGRISQKKKYLIANEIYNMSIKYDNLDVDLICATITHESARTWRPTIVSPAGALGLMQIMPHTGKFLSKHEGVEWTKPEDILFNPINNIRMGCRYLSMLIEVYHVDGGLAAYNGGERRAARWLASGRNDEVLFEETRGYVPAVLKLYDTYKN